MKVGFVGGGKIAEAILDALLLASVVKAADIRVSDIDSSRRRKLSRRYGISATAVNRRVVEFADTVILAVKPQHLDTVLDDIAATVNRGHLIISIAAGKRLGTIEARLGGNVVRVMPNMGSVVREGMSAFCVGSRVSAAGKRRVRQLLSAVGDVLELPESQFDAVTAVSGSGPAFFAYILACITEAGVELGLARRDARRLAMQTFLGTARVLDEGIYPGPNELIDAVASAKGTTEAGMEVLNASSVKKTLIATIKAAATRSQELAG